VLARPPLKGLQPPSTSILQNRRRTFLNLFQEVVSKSLTHTGICGHNLSVDSATSSIGAYMAHVFISYSSKNRDYALKLARKLRDEGIEAWIDNAGIRSGDDWSQSIFAALRAASAVIVIMTPASLDSEWVRREVLLATETKKRIFPILLAGERWDMLVHLQYVDVRDSGALPPKAFFEELRVVLQVEIRVTGTAAVPPPAPPTDQITSLRGCLRNAVIIAALIGAVAAILAAIILVIGPVIFQSTPTPTPSAPTEMPTTEALIASSTPAASTMTRISPTDPPAATQAVLLTEPTAIQSTATQSGSVIVDVVRGRGIIALTTTDAIDLSGLQIVVDEPNEPVYDMGTIHPAITSSAAGQMWCIRQPDSNTVINGCDSENTYVTEDTGNSWRNANIIFRYNGSVIGECTARSGETALYACPSLIIYAP
jgi:TIR domain